jgi:isoaspartyl peptidase/L-asparaginase-like protein (Ntn-hydrolase superfamily)
MRWGSLVLVAVVSSAVAGCERGSGGPATGSAAEAPLPPRPWKAAAIAHGGQGSPPALSDGCRAAVDVALRALESGSDPVDAAVAGVVVLEDDPRFNAGTGSRVRLDGVTVQMDASVMTSDGRFGAVAGLEQVKNPVRVARAVMDTPHLLLAGDGAIRFARTLGFPAYDPATPEMKEKTRELQRKLVTNDPSLPPEWRSFDWRARWNFERPPDFVPGAAARPLDAGTETVGVAVRAADGRFGVALSTGGTSLTLRGRVGDVPILGAGLFAGTHGATAATGTGERIVEAGLARKVHEWLAAGVTAEAAGKRALDLVGAKNASLIVISPTEMYAATEAPMAWAARESGGLRWLGP